MSDRRTLRRPSVIHPPLSAQADCPNRLQAVLRSHCFQCWYSVEIRSTASSRFDQSACADKGGWITNARRKALVPLISYEPAEPGVQRSEPGVQRSAGAAGSKFGICHVDLLIFQGSFQNFIYGSQASHSTGVKPACWLLCLLVDFCAWLHKWS